jgi:hypothetical protein
MRIPTFVCSFLLATVVAGCTAKVETSGNAAAQSAVEATAKMHPDVVRLTVHMVPAAGGASTAIASTAADKIGKPSDKEDLEAMASGKPVVMDEKDAVDVTVPVMQKDGKWTAAIGVTLKAAAGADKEALKKKATEIATAVEKAIGTAK